MGNPYYIAPSSPNHPAVDAVGTLGKLYDVYQTGKNAAERNRLTAKEIEQRGRISEQANQRALEQIDISRQNVGVAQRRNELTEAKLAQGERQADAHKQNFGLSKVYSLRGIFKQKGIELDNVMKPVTDYMEGLARDPEVNNAAAYMDIKQKYPAFREQVMENIGKEMEKLLSDDTPDAMQGERIQKLQGLLQDFEQDREGKIVDMVFGPTRMALAQEQALAQATVAKAMPDQWSDPYTDQYGNIVQRNLVDGQLKKISSPDRNTVIRTTPDGGTEVVLGASGAAGNSDLGKKTRNTIEEEIRNARDSRQRLLDMRDQFDKKFLKIGERIKHFKTKWQDKLEGTWVETFLGKASPEDIEEAKKYWNWRRNSVGNLNKEIKWLTGAAMNKEEVPRLTEEVPNPGLNLFDGDSPEQFEAKLKDKLEQTNFLIARYEYMLQNGVSQSGIKTMGNMNKLPSRSEIKQEINSRAEEMENQGIPPEQVKAELAKEFGMFAGVFNAQ